MAEVVPTKQSQTESPESPRQERAPRKRRRRWAWLAGIAAALLISYWGFVTWVDRTGWDFFHKGHDTVVTLEQMAEALKQQDLEALRAHYASDYQGPTLGLAVTTLADERDGVRVYRFGPGTANASLGGVVDEWERYLTGFESIDEVGIYVHRLDRWRSDTEIEATLRFELIGTPRGESRPGIDRAYFKARFDRDGKSLTIRETTLIEGDRVIADRDLFVNVAAEAGIDFENRYYPGFLEQELAFGMLRYGPGGITAADYDSDGLDDLFVPDGVESRLFRNLGTGQFEDVTERVGLAGLSGVSVALFADYDNDGDRDFFVTRTFEPNQLFENQDGQFVDVTARSGLDPDNCSTVASWADYDLDGRLDLYVGRYLEARETIPTTFYARNGQPNQLYHNNGDGTFTNVTEEAGVGEVGLCLGSAFGDYDDDGDPDLYVSNDFGRKTLYRNNGDGTFDDVTVQTGTLAYGAGMSSTIGDYDNDGDLDFYVAHIRSEDGWFAEWPTVMRYMVNSWRQGVWKTDMPLYMQILRQSGMDFVDVFHDMAAGNTLLRNNGDGTFSDVSWEAGANPPGWFWGTNLVDFDNDGWQDLYAANGWVYNEKGTEIELEFLNNVVSEQKMYKSGQLFDPNYFGTRSWHGWERNRYLRNNGDGTFSEIGRGYNNDLLLNSRGTAVADFWNRGVMDLAVAASTDRHALLRNEIDPERHWVQFVLTGAAGELPEGTNRDAVGARVTLRSGDRTMLREVILGDGYASQSTLRLHFGLGEVGQIDEVEVRWPRSGKVERFGPIEPDRLYTIHEGRGELGELVASARPGVR